MKRVLFIAGLLVACLAGLPNAFAQHAGDVTFKYDSGQIVLTNGETGFIDGHRIYEAEFAVGGIFDGFSDEPGFISETDVGLGIGANDEITYNILSSPSHGQFMHFWDPGTGGLGSLGANIRIRTQDALGGETLISETGLSRTGSGLIGQADAMGDFHSHIDLFLEDTASGALAPGAYAALASLGTNALGVIDSEPFWIVWGYDISETEHEAAVEFFAGSAVPEPSGLAIIGLAAIGLARHRRSKV